MRRFFAVVAAAAMVAGSLALRSRLDRGGGGAHAGPLRVVCAAELGPACAAVDRGRAAVWVEAAGRTADRLSRGSAAEAGVDAWLAPAPWPEIVDGRRQLAQLAPLFPAVSPALARSPLVLVTRPGLGDALAGRCRGPVGWKCLGEAAAAGQAKPGHADPGTDAFGALVLGQAASAYFGRDDLSTFDLDDPGFAGWLVALERAAPPLVSGGSPLNEMLGTGFAAFDAVGTVEAEAAPVLAAAAAGSRQAVLLYPSPMATADVVVASAGGATTRRARDVVGGDAVLKALAGSGWRVEGTGRPAGPPLPAGNGLPSPGLLDALRARAQEARR